MEMKSCAKCSGRFTASPLDPEGVLCTLCLYTEFSRLMKKREEKSIARNSQRILWEAT